MYPINKKFHEFQLFKIEKKIHHATQDRRNGLGFFLKIQ